MYGSGTYGTVALGSGAVIPTTSGTASSPSVYGGNCCCVGKQHGALAIAPRYGWGRKDALSLDVPTTAAEVRDYCRIYTRKTATVASGSPPACFSAILPAVLDANPRTGQTSGTNWKDYLNCDSNSRISFVLAVVSETVETHQVQVLSGGSYVNDFVVQETLSEEFTDELMEEILDELIDGVDWGDLLLFDDAHQCHIGYRYDASGNVETFAAELDEYFDGCSAHAKQLLQFVTSGIAFYGRMNWTAPYGLTVMEHAADDYWFDYADAILEDASNTAGTTYSMGAKWTIHSRQMRQKRSTRTLSFDTTWLPIWWFDPDLFDAEPAWFVDSSHTFGSASDTSPTSCTKSNWTIEPPNGGDLGYPLSAFVVVARGHLSSELGY